MAETGNWNSCELVMIRFSRLHFQHLTSHPHLPSAPLGHPPSPLSSISLIALIIALHGHQWLSFLGRFTEHYPLIISHMLRLSVQVCTRFITACVHIYKAAPSTRQVEKDNNNRPISGRLPAPSSFIFYPFFYFRSAGRLIHFIHIYFQQPWFCWSNLSFLYSLYKLV